MPRWKRTKEGREIAPFRLTMELSRRQYATLLNYANEIGVDFKTAMESIWFLGYDEIAKTYDPVEKKVTVL